MRRRSKTYYAREKWIIIAASGFVLAALTLSGIYMRNKSLEEAQDRYDIDYDILDKNPGSFSVNNNDVQVEFPQTEDDLDYDPLEAPIVKAPVIIKNAVLPKDSEPVEMLDIIEDPDAFEGITYEEEPAPVAEALHFEGSLIVPVNSETLIDYCMDSTVYFSTLDQYRYNPAIIFSAQTGMDVYAAAAGKVVAVKEDSRLGKMVVMDIGDGYQAVYGQLSDITVMEGNVIPQGTVIGKVANPTRYYTLEGPNLYFQVTQNSIPVDPNQYM